MRSASAINAYYGDAGVVGNDYDRHVVAVDGAVYDSLDAVMQAHPQLGVPEGMALYCEAWIRLHHGTGYRVIRDPAEFAGRYRMLAQRRHSAVRTAHSAADCPVYDVTEVGEPRLQDDVLRCYVEDRLHGLPYRVEFPWPPRPDVVVEFLLLPLQDDDDDGI
jgi:hypothetical protein